jgi:hypothetical protein
MATAGSGTARAESDCVNGPVKRTYKAETVNISKIATERHERDDSGTAESSPPTETFERTQNDEVEQPPAAGAQRAPDSNGLLSIGTDYDGVRETTSATFFGLQAAPPDTNLAAGRSKHVEVINKTVAIFNQRSGKLELRVPLDNFFDPIITEDTFVNDFPFVADPRVRYDQEADRFLIVALFFHIPTANSAYFLAASDNSNPNGKWHLYRLTPAIDKPGLVDYPLLGVDQDAVYLTELFIPFTEGSEFPFDSDVTLEILDKDALYAGEAVATNHFTGLLDAEGITLIAQPAFQPSSGGESGSYYLMGNQVQNQLIGQEPDPDDTFTLWEITNPLTNPTVSCLTIDVAPWTYPPYPEQPDTGVQIDPVGGRLMNLDYNDGTLWTTHTIRYNWSDGADNDVAIIRWYEIDPEGPSVIQYGSLGDTGTSYFLPHIRSNDERTLVGYNVSGPETYPGIEVAGRTADTTQGEMGDTELVQKGESSLVHPELFVNRDPVQWGDYMSLSVHPTSGRFWVAGEYSPGYDIPLDADEPDRYQTRIAEISFDEENGRGNGS